MSVILRWLNAEVSLDKNSFDQLLSQMKNLIPINFTMNSTSPKIKNLKTENNSENFGVNYGSNNNYNINPFKDTHSIVNNNTVSVNILDPTIIFKGSEIESVPKSQQQQQKRSPQINAIIKNTLKKM